MHLHNLTFVLQQSCSVSSHFFFPSLVWTRRSHSREVIYKANGNHFGNHLLIVLSLAFLVLPLQVTAATNLLRHSSFEVPGNNHWGFVGSKLRPADLSTDAQHGQYSLIWPYRNPLVEWPRENPVGNRFYERLYYQPVTAVAGQTYTLSAYAKQDADSSQTTIFFEIFDGNRNKVTKLAGTSFALSTSWQRYSWELTLPAATTDRYVIRIGFTGVSPVQDPYPTAPYNHGLLDAVQFEQGALTAYNTQTPVEFGLDVAADSNAFVWGADVTMTLYVANNSGAAYSKTVTLVVEDYFGNTVSQTPIALDVADGTRHQQTLNLGSALRGHYRALIVEGSTVHTEKVFATIPPAKVVSAADGMFGADLTLSAFVLNQANRLGFTWGRPHSELGWSRVESVDNTFTFPDNQVARAAANGIHLYGFLYRLPAWADTNNDNVPDNLADWRDYVSKIATHYSGALTHWEILNEPCQYSPPPSSSDYLAMVQAAEEEIHAVEASEIVFGFGPNTCYQDVETQLAAEFDTVVSTHLYPNESNVQGRVFLNYLLGQGQVNGQTREVWNTEAGATGEGTFYRTKSDYDPDDARNWQTQGQVKMWVQHKAANAKLFYYWMQFPTEGVDHTPGYSYSWTMNEYDSALKPNATASAVAAYYLDGGTITFDDVIYDSAVDGAPMTLYHFVEGTNDNVLVAWTDSTGIIVELTHPNLPVAVTIHDMFGKQVAAFAPGENLSYHVGNAPVYLVIDGYDSANLNQAWFPIGLLSTPESINIVEDIAGDTNPVTVEIFGSSTNPLGTDAPLYSQSVPQNSQISYAWTAPVHMPDNDTLLLYHFDQRSEFGESATVAHDFSGNNRDATVNGLLYGNTFGKFGGGLQGNGSFFTDSNVQISHEAVFNGLTAFTIELWVRLDEGGRVRLFSKGDIDLKSPGTAPLLVWVRETGDDLRFQVSNGTTTRERIGKALPRGDGLYHHLAFVFDGAPAQQEQRRLDIYLDGQLVNGNLRGNLDGNCPTPQPSPSPSCTLPGNTDAGDTNDLYIAGLGGTSPVQMIDGEIDEFVMYDRALSAQEIFEHSQLIPGKTYYWFVRTIGETVQDSSIRSKVPGSTDSSTISPATPSAPAGLKVTK